MLLHTAKKHFKKSIWRQRLRWAVTTSIMSLVLVCLVNCTPQTRYKTLSFFFDGVPNPDASTASANGNNRSFNGRFSGKTESVHKPFDDGDCNACHEGNVRSGTMIGFDKLKSPTASVCMNCHKDVPNAFRYMHGPVAVGVCLMCHDPHDAPRPHLLKLASPALCLQCHQREDLGPPQIVHANTTVDCLSCHTGHGAPQHGLLRESMMQNVQIIEEKIQAPTTKPAQQSPTTNTSEVK
jgi:predicted CXXCH cytochrome family protein